MYCYEEQNKNKDTFLFVTSNTRNIFLNRQTCLIFFFTYLKFQIGKTTSARTTFITCFEEKKKPFIFLDVVSLSLHLLLGKDIIIHFNKADGKNFSGFCVNRNQRTTEMFKMSNNCLYSCILFFPLKFTGCLFFNFCTRFTYLLKISTVTLHC